MFKRIFLILTIFWSLFLILALFGCKGEYDGEGKINGIPFYTIAIDKANKVAAISYQINNTTFTTDLRFKDLATFTLFQQNSVDKIDVHIKFEKFTGNMARATITYHLANSAMSVDTYDYVGTNANAIIIFAMENQNLFHWDIKDGEYPREVIENGPKISSYSQNGYIKPEEKTTKLKEKL